MKLFERRSGWLCGIALSITSAVFAGGGTCCPNDLDGDGEVGASDLSILLGGWGICSADCSSTMVVGRITRLDGSPVAHAVVTSSLGGQGVSGTNGSFGFSVTVTDATASLSVTAITQMDGETYLGTQEIVPVEANGVTDAGIMSVAPGATCPSTWLPGFGAGTSNGKIYSVTAFDDGSGSGPSLVVGGQFSSIGGVAANNVARWNGTSWTAMGAGFNSVVADLAVIHSPNGTSDTLYAGGFFTSSGGSSLGHIARWNGTTWSPLGSGVDAIVRDLLVVNDGTPSPSVVAAGDFLIAGGVSAPKVARWDGATWSGYGTGPGQAGSVFAVAVCDDGTIGGPALYAGGSAGIPGRVAKWNGSAWVSVGGGIDNANVFALASYRDPATGRQALYAGGSFTGAGGQAAAGIAMWNGVAWSSVGSGISAGGWIYSLSVFDDGTGHGPRLFASGEFTTAGGVPAERVAAWDGSQWTGLGGAIDGPVRCVRTADLHLGGGTILYAGGDFTAGPAGQPYLARFGCVPGTNDRRR